MATCRCVGVLAVFGALALAHAGGPHAIARVRVTEGAAAQVKIAKPKKDPAKDASKDPPKDLAVPFRAGEKLTYRVAWATFSNAANVELDVVEQRDLYGWKAWHFRALAHTAGSVRSLFTIDDQFDSYTDAQNADCHQFEMYLDELGRKQNQTLRLVAQGQKTRGDGPSVIVQPGTRDPLGAVNMLRGVDWKQTPEVRAPLYDGRNLFEMRARMESSSEKVATAAGNFDATRISIHLFQYGKQVADDNFTIWFAHDEARRPVAMQADLPFGSLHVELVPAGK